MLAASFSVKMYPKNYGPKANYGKVNIFWEKCGKILWKKFLVFIFSHKNFGIVSRGPFYSKIFLRFSSLAFDPLFLAIFDPTLVKKSQ